MGRQSDETREGARMKPLIVVKIGGKAAADSALGPLISEMSSLQDNWAFCFVHGGGAEVTRVSSIFGLQAVFKDGVRQTSEPEMEVVDMVLAGRMNTQLVRRMNAHGLPAVGLTGADAKCFTAKKIAPDSLTGEIVATDNGLLFHLIAAGYLPVLSSVSMDDTGLALNINADEAALHVAISLAADKLVYISDIPGVLAGGECLPALDRKRSEELIGDGTISGGMIPKVQSCLGGLEQGVKEVVIGDYRQQGDLNGLLLGKKGTKLTLD
jgi:acetylglutamate kinase